MPIINGQGQGNCTTNKQDGLSAILRQHINIVQSVLAKHTYYPQQYVYIDLYAGSGKNQEVDCDGSPVIFLNTIDGRMGYKAYFIELEPGNCESLKRAVSFTNSNQVINGDNSVELPIVLNKIPTKSYGMIYADPNGLPDFDMLAEAAKSHIHLDILIRYQATSAKRNRRVLTRDDLLKIKDQWIVREPVGKHQWTFLFGTNYDVYRAWKKYGFYRWDEPAGQAIFNKLAYTKEQLSLLDPDGLYPESARSKVFKRSGGLCEMCHKRPATEINHLSYRPPVDVPENMLAVCHLCHCEIHGVDN